MVGVSIEGVGPPARGFSHNPGLLSPAHPVPTQALPSRGSRGPVKADSTSGSSVFSTSVSVSVPETEASGLETQTPFYVHLVDCRALWSSRQWLVLCH